MESGHTPTLFVRLLEFSFAFAQLIRVASTNRRDLNAWFVAFTLLSGAQAGRAEEDFICVEWSASHPLSHLTDLPSRICWSADGLRCNLERATVRPLSPDMFSFTEPKIFVRSGFLNLKKCSDFLTVCYFLKFLHVLRVVKRTKSTFGRSK
jgi:hypothetical protein